MQMGNKASQHEGVVQYPVEASSAEVATEVKAVERSAVHLCPIEVVLERIIATPTGNVLACWQILGGTDPAAVRRCNNPHPRRQLSQRPII